MSSPRWLHFMADLSLRHAPNDATARTTARPWSHLSWNAAKKARPATPYVTAAANGSSAPGWPTVLLRRATPILPPRRVGPHPGWHNTPTARTTRRRDRWDRADQPLIYFTAHAVPCANADADGGALVQTGLHSHGVPDRPGCAANTAAAPEWTPHVAHHRRAIGVTVRPVPRCGCWINGRDFDIASCCRRALFRPAPTPSLADGRTLSPPALTVIRWRAAASSCCAPCLEGPLHECERASGVLLHLTRARADGSGDPALMLHFRRCWSAGAELCRSCTLAVIGPGIRLT